MVLPVLIALLQAPAPPPLLSPPIEADARPVRVWLGTTGSLVRGQSVPVFVQAAQDGDLIVLHRRTDGRIEVLFPSNPAADPFVRSGTYEIRGAGNRAAWVVSEPEGSGMILAALSADPLRFDEFVRTAGWNPDALVPSWNDASAEGALSDIVQRMLGDGAFNYDLVSYTVAPPIYAQQPSLPAPSGMPDLAQGDEQQPDTTPNYGSYPVCLNCTFIGYEEIIIAPEHHRGGRGARQQDDGICGIHTPCAESQKTHALALARPMSQSAVVAPRSRPVEPIQYRSRVPPTGSVAVAKPRTRAASTPLRHVRFTSLSAPESDRRVVLTAAEGGARPAANGAESGRGGRAAVADGGGGGGAIEGRGAAAMAGRTERAGTTVPRPRSEAQPAPRSAGAAVANGRAPSGPRRGIALPSTGFQGAQARVPANRGGTRRR
ncbi:MAG TPA: DUF4384 domain-containing protein [Gemmatimonadales bacterium]|nr:DUF4384 domain-containing protein [Gemmatimonadales bacterium]